ncbi:DUF3006 domain-containing protein [Caldicellulosiruptoraceae bacterium PP1]
MKVVVDRIEGDFAVVELPDRTIVNMPIILLPKEVKEGDVIIIEIDKKETKQRLEKTQKLFEELSE